MSDQGRQQPAILLITADQLRRDALGCYGNEAVATPNLDRLAARGTVYDRAYTASPWCLPSRTSLITGEYPRTHRSYSNFRDCRLAADRPNLYRELGRLGYTTGHVGKCHYAPVPYSSTVPDRTLPYREFRDYYVSLGIDHLDLQDDKQVSVWFYDDYAVELERAGHLSAYRDATWDRERHKVFTFPGPAEWHPDAWVGRKTAEWIESYDGSAPLFTWASFSGPHFPFDPPEEYLAAVDAEALGEPDIRPGEFDDPGRIHHRSHHGPARGWIESGENRDRTPEFWRRLRRHYMANVALIDEQVGRVLDAAERRFGDDLVVILSCDHGEMLGNHGLWGKGNCFYDDVVRVPLIVRHPGQEDAGTRDDRLVSLVDVYPTLLTAAGGDPGTVDGAALGHGGHEHVFSEGEGFVMVTDGHRKLVVVRKDGGDHVELFDLDTDPHEFTDLAKDPAAAGWLRQMQSAALGAMVDTVLP